MTTLSANLSDSATEMRVNAADSTPAPYYQIDDEIVRLLQNSTTAQVGQVSPNRELDLTLWQIERGDAETTPAAHLSGATLEPLWPQVPGEGGAPGESVVLSASVELTNAQVITLPTTPVQIVAAPGAGQALIPISTVLHKNSLAGAYTGVDAGFYFALVWGEWAVEASTYGTGETFMEAANVLVYVLGPSVIDAAAGYSGVYGGIADLEDAPLKLVASNGADFTGGNAANTLAVTVLYAVIDV